jgi:hypothetical protein
LIYQPVRLGLLDNLAHADVWTEHGLAWRLLPESLADLADLDALLRQQAQNGSRAWLDDFRALREQLGEQCQAKGVKPFLNVLNGYSWEIDQATEVIHRETCAANVQAGMLAECVPLPSVGPMMESYLDQEQRKLEAELTLGVIRKNEHASLRRLRRLGPELEALAGLTPCQYGVVWARGELQFLGQLVAAQFQGPYVMVDHPGVTATYLMLRQNLLMNLGEAELAEWQTWADN